MILTAKFRPYVVPFEVTGDTILDLSVSPESICPEWTPDRYRKAYSGGQQPVGPGIVGSESFSWFHFQIFRNQQPSTAALLASIRSAWCSLQIGPNPGC